MLGQRNDRCDRQGIRREVGCGGRNQQDGGIVLCPENGYVVDAIREANGKRGGTGVKDHLHQSRAIAIKALGQDRRASQRKRLGETQFQNAQQDEQEVHRHRARDPGQIDLEP